MRVAWRFIDPITSDTYFLPVNPTADSGSFDITKTVKYAGAISTYRDNTDTLRVNDTILTEAPDSQPVFSYTGTVYTKDQFDKLKEWFEKEYPWQIRDDLGRDILGYVDKYSTERARSTKFKWKHTYSFSGVILEELGV